MYESTDKRDRTLDILKGLGIILMVLGHMHFDDIYFGKYIFGFHMPLFFIVSGFLYNNHRSIKLTIVDKAKSLLVPYIVCGLMYYIIYLSMNIDDPEKYYHLFTVVVWSTRGIKIEAALWFLPAMFFTGVIYRIIDEYIRKDWYKSIMVVILCIVGWMCSTIFGVRLPWSLDSALVALSFYHIGFLFKKYDIISKLRRIGGGGVYLLAS